MKKIRFGSVCSCIEAASVAFEPLGWEAAWFSEIEPFPSSVLAYHYPNIPNLGDMRLLPQRIRSGEIEAPDVLCGGTPCQAWSVAGERRSLDDDRGNLSLTFCEIADAIDERRLRENKQPVIIFWENVPGVLKTHDNAFGHFLSRLAGASNALSHGPVGKWGGAGVAFGQKRIVAWRTLDSQYFGVPQRRRRVYVVASSRTSGINPAKILFERQGLSGHLESSEKSEQKTTCFAESSFGTFSEQSVAGVVRASGGTLGGGSESLVLSERLRPVTQ